MKILRGEDDIELAVDVDDVPFAELAGDDLHVCDPWLERGPGTGRPLRIRGAT
jgi:hypothetical protein